MTSVTEMLGSEKGLIGIVKQKITEIYPRVAGLPPTSLQDAWKIADGFLPWPSR